MNERFEPTAGLRAYFRDLDRVAPADGQLTEVLIRTALVAQRPAWRARLPRVEHWGALGRPVTLGYALLAAALLLVALALGSGGGRPRGPFEGRWTSSDTDGSTQLLDVSAGATPSVRFEDLMASGCRDHGDDSVDFLAVGTAIIVGDELTAGFPSGGGCNTWQVPPFQATYRLDRASGTLTDGDGTVWHRTP